MKRRQFIISGTLVTGGGLLLRNYPVLAAGSSPGSKPGEGGGLYSIFRNPDPVYRPFVRWWWNGDKIEADELVRELRLLKEAGIGGVEINPIEFPSRIPGDDLGIPSLTWLSDEWIEMLQVTFDEAKRLGITCDLIVGSGWPFGAESLDPEERAEVMLLYAEKVTGPAEKEINHEEVFSKVDPQVTLPFPGRTFEMVSLKISSDPMSGLGQVTDINIGADDTTTPITVPPGNHVIYAMVRVSSFASVINGAPGAAGPILNHMDREAVRRYLDHMSGTIEARTGPLSNHLRAFFTDSMELEGCNWTSDFAEQFERRRGYDIMPWLPFIMFKVGRLGGVVDDRYGAAKIGIFAEEINRVRFDFEYTKAELLNERFTQTYLEWCSDNNVKSRAQAYGRGFFPLETSLGYDIPEGESWTTNWLKHRVGEEMPDDDYRRGRAYTMINKYVSSAAHLDGRRVVSCEEMTNTYLVFNTSLERLKVGSDQSLMSGITHSVWHGFNYSPPQAPYPGWIQYGSYYNENNNWWPWFDLLNTYKARISALLQNADMYSDIAILPANYDLWSEMGVQTDPFPEKLNVPWTSLLWEAVCKNGGAADYISEIVINGSEVKEGRLCYGPRRYSTIFLAGVTSISPEAMEKLHDFVVAGGRLFCIERYPEKSPGYTDYAGRDREVQKRVERMKEFPDRFILLNIPEDNRLMEWYSEQMIRYNLPHYLDIEKPSRFMMQIRYRSDEGSEIILLTNTHINDRYESQVTFGSDITGGRYGWIWDPETGSRYRIKTGKDGSFRLTLGPAESRIFVFDRKKRGEEWKPVVTTKESPVIINGPWHLEFIHSRGEEVAPLTLQTLCDLKEMEDYQHFSGTIIYRTELELENAIPEYLNPGRVEGVTTLKINGHDCGSRWYGERIYPVAGVLVKGINSIEIRVVTLMGNYMKSLTDNPNAQYWTNLNRKVQPLVSLGLAGPVRFCQ